MLNLMFEGVTEETLRTETAANAAQNEKFADEAGVEEHRRADAPGFVAKLLINFYHLDL